MNLIKSTIDIQSALIANNLITNKEHSNTSTLRGELIEGLSAYNKYISSKFFYNKYGSQLFEWITQLPEYYPTRTEKAILNKYSDELFGQLSHVNIIELGSGDCSKISIVLDAISAERLESIQYYPVDFSPSSILNSKAILNKAYPNLETTGIIGDFTQLSSLPNERPRIICFFGSTIGNLEVDETEQMLQNIQQIMNPGDQLIMGMDLVKDISILEAAYNDSQRITEAFNKNILRNCNHILKTNFYPPIFKHVAFFNSEKSRIEMHLSAKEHMLINSPFLKQCIEIQKGESIHTENSHKYSIEAINELAAKCKLTIKRLFYDDKKWFSLVQLTK